AAIPAAVDRALSFYAEDRPQSIDELRTALGWAAEEAAPTVYRAVGPPPLASFAADRTIAFPPPAAAGPPAPPPLDAAGIGLQTVAEPVQAVPDDGQAPRSGNLFTFLFSFRGRVSRLRYWMFILFSTLTLVIAVVVGAIIAAAAGHGQAASPQDRAFLGIMFLVVLIPYLVASFAVGVKRL